MTVEGVVVEGHLRIHRVQAAVLCLDQRVDLDEEGILLHEDPVELLEDGHRLLHESHVVEKLEGSFAGQEVGHAEHRVDGNLDDLLGGFLRDRLDVHAARAAEHHECGLGLAVHQDAHVVLGFDFRSRHDHDAVHDEALDVQSEDGLGLLADFGFAAGELDAAGLAAAAGVDLRLDHYAGCTQLPVGFHRFFRGSAHDAGINGHPVIREKFFRLIFVNFHI